MASMPFSSADHVFMSRALQLAACGLYSTSPNPRVGCVLVEDDANATLGARIIGEGWHLRAGAAHAEINALNSLTASSAKGCTAYVTLEPCNHHGRTPPCCDALIAAGVKRVVVAMQDPNPLVAGQGCARLHDAGIEVAVGLLAEEASELNIGFVSRMTRQRPWLRLKIAASLDGKSALANGQSQWLTAADARRDGHAWRARSCAMLTGIGTVRDDNPRLSVREIATSRQPLRVLVDSRLEVPLDAAILADANCLIAYASAAPEKIAQLRDRGIETLCLPNPQGKVDLPALLQALAQREINEVMSEAGVKLNGSLLREGCVDELLIYQAPLLLGDQAQGMFDFGTLTQLSAAKHLNIIERRNIGKDLFLRARLS